jgi:hypothetical protein
MQSPTLTTTQIPLSILKIPMIPIHCDLSQPLQLLVIAVLGDRAHL